MLRYYEELGIDDIAETLGISRNSVKTHLKRGLAAMEQRLGRAREPTLEGEVDAMSVVEERLRDALLGRRRRARRERRPVRPRRG